MRVYIVCLTLEKPRCVLMGRRGQRVFLPVTEALNLESAIATVQAEFFAPHALQLLGVPQVPHSCLTDPQKRSDKVCYVAAIGPWKTSVLDRDAANLKKYEWIDATHDPRVSLDILPTTAIGAQIPSADGSPLTSSSSCADARRLGAVKLVRDIVAAALLLPCPSLTGGGAHYLAPKPAALPPPAAVGVGPVNVVIMPQGGGGGQPQSHTLPPFVQTAPPSKPPLPPPAIWAHSTTSLTAGSSGARMASSTVSTVPLERTVKVDDSALPPPPTGFGPPPIKASHARSTASLSGSSGASSALKGGDRSQIHTISTAASQTTATVSSSSHHPRKGMAVTPPHPKSRPPKAAPPRITVENLVRIAAKRHAERLEQVKRSGEHAERVRRANQRLPQSKLCKLVELGFNRSGMSCDDGACTAILTEYERSCKAPESRIPVR